jgi:outer membrane protein OmpA-like peptidoglycan-associated protein
VIEEKPFQATIQPPQAGALKSALDRQGRVALYVNFETAKATLKPDAAKVVAEVVKLLKANPGLKLSIEGHTDNVGAQTVNEKLSRDRAAAVVDALAAAGIARDRLRSAAHGPDKPIACNGAGEGRAKNRRVELVKG